MVNSELRANIQLWQLGEDHFGITETSRASVPLACFSLILTITDGGQEITLLTGLLSECIAYINASMTENIKLRLLCCCDVV